VKYRKHVALSKFKTPFLPAAAIFLFVFICFIPNPALLSLGNNTGLQAGQLLALLFLPVALILGLPRRQMLALLLLVLPVLTSTFLGVVTRHVVDSDVAFSSMVASGLAFVILIPAGVVASRISANKSYMTPLLSGVALAVVVHVIVGGYQAYSFASDVFPLKGLYQNTSFLSADPDVLDRWATWTKRPFGLFPEPSAMAASIGPWLILIAGLLLNPKLQFQYGIMRGTKALLILAVVSGVGLVIMSSSGFTPWLLGGLLLVALPTLKRQILRLHRPRNALALFAIILVGVAIAVIASNYVGDRVAGNDASWSARGNSIVWALSFLGTSWQDLFFGAGPGQAYYILQIPALRGSLPAGGSGGLAVSAVWSLVVNYIQETGLVGALALALLLIVVLRAIHLSSARLIGLSCLIPWLVGVILTTSYLPLLPIWLFFSVLLVWDRIFEARAIPEGLNSKSGDLPARRRAREMRMLYR
jgi:hypothetical protein